MLRFFVTCGIFVWPLILLAMVIGVLSIRKLVDLYIRGNLEDRELASGLDAILFGGALSAVLGILGQVVAIYHSSNKTLGTIELSPTRLAMGFADSFATTIFGLVSLLVSALIWFALRSRYREMVIRSLHEK